MINLTREEAQQVLDALDFHFDGDVKDLELMGMLRSRLKQTTHASDCAVHNEPAYPAGECDCARLSAPETPYQVGQRLQRTGFGISDIPTSVPHDDNIAEALRGFEDARVAQPEPEPEPVAWIFQHEDTGQTDCIDNQQVEWGFEKNNPRWQKIAPLYTTPPQRKECQRCGEVNPAEIHTCTPKREWVGLTDDEKEDMLKGSKNAYDAVERIEAKLKEKNA